MRKIMFERIITTTAMSQLSLERKQVEIAKYAADTIPNGVGEYRGSWIDESAEYVGRMPIRTDVEVGFNRWDSRSTDPGGIQTDEFKPTYHPFHSPAGEVQ